MIRIEPWGKGDLGLLEKCLADPAMMQYLGGPESPEKIAERQTRYEQPGSKQYKIVDEATGEGAGWVGYWDREWQDAEVYEIGWAVIPAFQGRGIASAATLAALDIARAERARRFVHAYPSVENAASNAVCRKCGFVLRGAFDFEYPEGHPIVCNDWRFDLFEDG
jgi:RimJ/RimL family protein N-acetyltransferase